jgi:hypothetical protein
MFCPPDPLIVVFVPASTQMRGQFWKKSGGSVA